MDAGQTKYQQMMAKLGLEEENLFEIVYHQISYFVSALSSLYEEENLLDGRSMLLRFIRRMVNIMRSIYVLYKTTADRASMMILTRSVIDINATIHFFFRYVTDPEELSLRILLFQLDGVRTRLGLSDEPLKPRDPEIISEAEYEETLRQRNVTRTSDLKAKEGLERMIKQSAFYPEMHRMIFQKAIWKYKDIRKNDKYSWEDLYVIACEEKGRARFAQDYLSHYVHGVGIADIQSSSIDETNPVFSLNICVSILDRLNPIIQSWFPDDYEVLVKASRTEMGEMLLSNLPLETLEEYSRKANDKDSN